LEECELFPIKQYLLFTYHDYFGKVDNSLKFKHSFKKVVEDIYDEISIASDE
jgi:hypothetical protein